MQRIYKQFLHSICNGWNNADELPKSNKTDLIHFVGLGVGRSRVDSVLPGEITVPQCVTFCVCVWKSTDLADRNAFLTSILFNDSFKLVLSYNTTPQEMA